MKQKIKSLNLFLFLLTSNCYAITLFLFFIFFTLFAPISFASEPLANNVFGIHLAQPHKEDLIKAAQLVNSSGGDWGYVTLVIEENDRQQDKWQEIFDQLRELHLIPIIRLATKPKDGNWQKPNIIEADGWASFLNSLNWVIKNRYVVLFNEPNHASEWEGKVDPKEYAKIALEYGKKLKEKSPDFFVMMAGLDASSPQQPPIFWDEYLFLKEIFQTITIDDFERYFDGWASHSYPNPDFSSSPYRFGRGSLYTYRWEIEILKNFGVKKYLPVFITETGWKRSSFLTEDKIAQYLQVASEDIWMRDPQIMAVTPFILNYQEKPFIDFSWRKYQSDDFYSYYYTVQSLPKIKGDPAQEEKGEVRFSLPKELVAHSQYHFSLVLKNNGQAIWDTSDNYYLSSEINPEFSNIELNFQEIKDLKPYEEKKIDFFIKTKNKASKASVNFLLKKNNQVVLRFPSWSFSILPLPSLKIYANYWPFGKAKGNDFEIQIFNFEEKIVFDKKGVNFKNGVAELKDIQNITLNDLYRIVILKKGFLPRQSYLVFKKEGNQIKFKPLLPFDRNGDGKFSLIDLWIF